MTSSDEHGHDGEFVHALIAAAVAGVTRDWTARATGSLDSRVGAFSTVCCSNPDEAAPLEEEGASETASSKARAVRCSGVFLQHGAREGDQGFPPGAIVLTDNDSLSRSQVETDSKDGQCSSRLRPRTSARVKASESG